jgi:hypothetical protein
MNLDRIPVIQIDSWKRFSSVYEGLAISEKPYKTQWIYRGTGWKGNRFTSKLERIFGPFGFKEPERRLKLERALVREFRRKLSHHLSGPAPTDLLEVLALMRHYGGPTRLLDFSYSLFVATFFALERTEKGKNSEIWALNAEWCRSKLPDCYKPRGISKSVGSSEHDDDHITRTLFERPFPILYPVNPYQMNPRVTTQRGLFLFPGDITVKMEDLFFKMADEEPRALLKNLRRFVIPWKARRKMLLHLHRMNIGRASLFPGLDGFTESLNLSWWILDPNARYFDWEVSDEIPS